VGVLDAQILLIDLARAGTLVGAARLLVHALPHQVVLRI